MNKHWPEQNNQIQGLCGTSPTDPLCKRKSPGTEGTENYKSGAGEMAPFGRCLLPCRYEDPSSILRTYMERRTKGMVACTCPPSAGGGEAVDVGCSLASRHGQLGGLQPNERPCLFKKKKKKIRRTVSEKDA